MWVHVPRHWVTCTLEDVLVGGELVPDGGEVHGLLDDLAVPGDGFEVDRGEERPGVLVGFQLRHQRSARQRRAEEGGRERKNTHGKQTKTPAAPW